MSNDDSEQEFQRLAQIYSDQTNEQLLQIAQDSTALTEVAQRALDSELQRRKLSAPAVLSNEELEFRKRVTIAKFRDLPEALLAQGNLNSTGINSVLLDDNLVRMDWLWSNAVGGIKLQVETGDVAEALEILQQPIPEEFAVAELGEYVQPACPTCKSLDVTFQEIYKPIAYASLFVGFPLPVQREGWKCHTCGKEWQDDATASQSADTTAE